MLLLKVIQALDEYGVAHAVAGGYAVALHGAVRGTLDLDLVIRHREEDFVAAQKALASLGLLSRLPVDAVQVFRFRKEYLQSRNLVAWSFHNPEQPSELVDILLTADLSVLKTRTLRHGRHRIKVIALEDLIQMKKKSGRPQDLADVEALQALRGKNK